MIKQVTFYIALLLYLHSYAQYQHDSVKVSNGFIHFYIKGKGTPIVLLQGGPGFSSYYLRSIADSLSGYKCILIDYQGTGHSQYKKADSTWVSPENIINDVELVRQKLNIDKWIVLGHSYGTQFGLYYAVKYSQHVQKIILLACIGTDNQFQHYFEDNCMARLSDDDKLMLQNLEADTSSDLLSKQFKLNSILLQAYFYDRSKILPFLQSVPRDEITTFYNADFFNAYMSNPNFWTWDISKSVYNLLQAVRIIQGRQDPVNDGKQELLNEHMKNSKLFYIEQSGHFTWVEKPREFFSLLENALKN
ncbi:MAG TPA: alpha/beta hydrolase [Chitinophagaceae bacterium]|jgi:proline iminopeptidase